MINGFNYNVLHVVFGDPEIPITPDEILNKKNLDVVLYHLGDGGEDLQIFSLARCIENPETGTYYLTFTSRLDPISQLVYIAADRYSNFSPE